MPERNTLLSLQRLSACQTVADLGNQFSTEIAGVGMTAAASGMVTGARAIGPTPFHFAVWPEDWLALYAARNFVAIDPLPRWAIVSGEAASWSSVAARLSPKDPGHQVIAAASAYGFYEGFVTPVRSRNGDLGLVSVGGDRRAPLSAEDTLFLHSLSNAVLLHAEQLSPTPEPTLQPYTQREQECVALLKQGYSDFEIARALDISPATARFHVENARDKIGARNRIELAARSNLIGRPVE